MTPQLFFLSADPTVPEPPVQHLYLDAGRYAAVAIPHADPNRMAWNAWSGAVVGCNGPGTCQKGWLNRFHVWSHSFRPQTPLVSPRSDGRWDSPAAAAAAARPLVFDMPVYGLVMFYILGDYLDDRGGLSLRVTRIADPKAGGAETDQTLTG